MNLAYSSVDTIIAIATPQGAGAIGIVRLSGPNAVSAASSLIAVKAHASLADCPARQVFLGLLHNHGAPMDQVMVTVFRAPQSYTGEDVVEISCHGGRAILKQALDLFLRQGLRHAEPGEFSQRAFLNGKMDLAQAEGVADLIAAQTEESRAAAWAQVQGGLSAKIREVRSVLIEILAHLEVNLDHSDDPTVGATLPHTEMSSRLFDCEKVAENLERSYDYGRLLKEGVRVAIVGRPNVGKSSLLNKLLKSDRAIVTDVPGTTRDTLEEGFDLLGIPAVLIDTAGIRNSHGDPVEKIGIERTHQAIDRADVVLALFDQSEVLGESDRKIAELLNAKNRKIAVLNKFDLPTKINADEVGRLFAGSPIVSVSSLSGTGMDDLLTKLRASVPAHTPRDQEAEPLWVTSVRHRECLARTRESLTRARAACSEENMEECVALEVREGLDALGEIIGETVTEDILKEIFSKFCIGK